MGARWTRKHGKSYYSNKNHISRDRGHKLIRCRKATAANVQDSQLIDDLLDPSKTSADVWADSALRSQDQEQALAGQGYRIHIYRHS